MEFDYETDFGSGTPEAYERLLLDCMHGDATLFTRSDEIEEAWEIVEPILEHWRGGGRPGMYPKGSWGPASADELIATDGRSMARPARPMTFAVEVFPAETYATDVAGRITAALPDAGNVIITGGTTAAKIYAVLDEPDRWNATRRVVLGRAVCPARRRRQQLPDGDAVVPRSHPCPGAPDAR